MADQMSGAAMAMPQDPKAAFKAEWESLEIVQHQCMGSMKCGRRITRHYLSQQDRARQTKPFLIFYCLFPVFILSVNVGINSFNSISLYFFR